MSRAALTSLNKQIPVIKKLLEDFSWFLNHIKETNSRLNFPKRFIKFFTNVKQPFWASYYETPDKLNALPLFCFFTPGEIKELAAELETATPEEVAEFKIEFEDAFLEGFDEFISAVESAEPMPKWQIRAYLRNTPLDEQKRDLLSYYFFATAFLTQTFQLMALVNYGRTMCELVAAAKAGDNDALVKAIQVDRTVLVAIPYFSNTLISLQLGGSKALLENIGHAVSRKMLDTNFKYPELNIVFSLLHRDGYLKKLSDSELLDICQELGIYSSFETNNLSKLKNAFLKRQGSPLVR